MSLDPAQQILPRPFAAARGDKASLSRDGVDEALAFQLLIGALGRDHADAQILRQRADRRKQIPFVQLAAG